MLFLCCLLPSVLSNGCREGAAGGIRLCLGVLAPSLFPFMAAANLFVNCGGCRILSRPLDRAARAAFGLGGALAPVLLISLIGGYPVGAGGIAALRKQGAISENEAKHAALFMVCAGPGFVIGFVGEGIYRNRSIGLIIFAAQIISVLLTGIAAGFIFRRKEENNSVIENNTAPLPFSQALVEAVEDAAKGMLSICSFVVLFSALKGMTEQALDNKTAITDAAALLEVCGAAARLSENRSVEAVAFAVGFGGICVHCQLLYALGEIKVSRCLFFLFRIIQGILTALLTHIGLRMFPQKTAVFSTAHTENSAIAGGSVISGAVLITTAVCFLISVRQLSYNSIKKRIIRR